MTTITLNRKEVEKQIGKLDEKLQEKIVMAGIEIDSLTDEEVTIDVTPNRTDLLSTQGFVRYVTNYLGKTKPKDYKVKVSKEYEVVIDNYQIGIQKICELGEKNLNHGDNTQKFLGTLV